MPTKTLKYHWKLGISQIAIYTIGLMNKNFNTKMTQIKIKNRSLIKTEKKKKYHHDKTVSKNKRFSLNKLMNVIHYINGAKTIHKSPFFNASWYNEKHPDVTQAGVNPAIHFLKYGASLLYDPGPEFSSRFYFDTHPGLWKKNINPLLHFHRNGCRMAPDYKTILWAAANVAVRGEYARAVALAERYLPDNLSHTSQILRANAALYRGNESDWLAHLNAYLAQFDVAPLVLEGEGTLLDRFATAPLPPVTGGPLVSVIMPAFNSEGTIRAAAHSILNQTWKNLELLIVDDASEDGTWTVMQEIAARDERVKIRRNKVNVGPYVSKNLALMEAQGEWITGHDADDWAHPQRLERHIRSATDCGSRASVCYMIRIQPDRFLGYITKITSFSPDGVARKALVSCLFQRDFLKKTLGFWDSVRFGADSEMIARAEKILGKSFRSFEIISMICLDHDNSLTNHPDHGVNRSGRISPIRTAYRKSWKKFHRKNSRIDPYLWFPLKVRPYPAPPQMVVPLADAEANISNCDSLSIRE